MPTPPEPPADDTAVARETDPESGAESSSSKRRSGPRTPPVPKPRKKAVATTTAHEIRSASWQETPAEGFVLPYEAQLRRAGKWALRIALALVAVYVLWQLIQTYAGVQTQVWWFDSLHHQGVYTTILSAQVVLFVVGFLVTALLVGGGLMAFHRFRPAFAPDKDRQNFRYHYHRHERRLWPWLLAVVTLWFAVRAGSAATGRWQNYLLWRHATSWGQQDPTYGRDASYYVDILPFHQFLVNLVSSATVHAIEVVLVAAFVYGALKFRGSRPRVAPVLLGLLSGLFALWVVLKGFGWWLGRYALTSTNDGPVTGPSYTDRHAVAPGMLVLIVVAVVVAALLAVNVRRQGWRLPIAAALVFLLGVQLVGNAWPALISRFRETPSAGRLNREMIADNLAATMKAYALQGRVAVVPNDQPPLTGAALTSQAARNAQVRVLDPNALSATFTVKQQIESYYQFKSTLDIDHYPVAGKDTDVAVALRELGVKGIARGSWDNAHTVYTHGYGFVAAPTQDLDPRTGVPNFINGGLPEKNQIPVAQPDIYFGQSNPSYSIVGQPAGSTKNIEFDHPGGTGAGKEAYTTYAGGGGVPIGTTFRRLLYALQLNSPNILFSKDVNPGSRLLNIRDPRSRVSALAPWLTLDGDVYPIVSDGHILWVVDGYTTTNNYPSSQTINLRSATSNTLNVNGASTQQAAQHINYMHNSVKATVDAYTGDVHLYEWDQQAAPDPILKTWESVFPGLVEPQAAIPGSVLSHLRYPQDFFDVQRQLLTQYHVTDPEDFYSGSGFWTVPTDPTVAASQAINGGGGAANTTTLPSTYMSVSADGRTPASYRLSSPLATLNGRDLAAFLSVDAVPGPNYGKFTVLETPPGGSIPAPLQIQNDIESSNEISKALTLQRGGNSQVLLGNLLAMPLGGRMLYVEPVYTRAASAGSFPILRHVIAVYGDGAPTFQPTLQAALDEALRRGGAS